MQTELMEVMRYTPKNKSVHTAARPYYALSYRLSGTGRLTTDTESITASKDDLLLVPRNTAYEHVATDEDILVFHFNIYSEPFYRFSVHSPADPAPYRERFLRAFDIWQNKEAGYLYKVQAIFYEILALMEAEGMLHGAEQDPLMARCRAYIDAHFEDSALSIAALARSFGCSEAYLRRRFAAAYGCAPKTYLSHRLMEQAVSLLQSGHFSHTEIAEKCGYKDVKYFRQAFRHHHGRSISEFMKTL